MDDKKYAEGGFVDIPNICYHSDNSRLTFDGKSQMHERYHLHKAIEIQQKFIEGEIDREEFNKLLKEESERYISVLNYRNQEIKCKIDSDRISQAIKEQLLKEKPLEVGRNIIVNGKEFTVKSENRTKDGWLEYVLEKN